MDDTGFDLRTRQAKRVMTESKRRPAAEWPTVWKNMAARICTFVTLSERALCIRLICKTTNEVSRLSTSWHDVVEIATFYDAISAGRFGMIQTPPPFSMFQGCSPKSLVIDRAIVDNRWDNMLVLVGSRLETLDMCWVDKRLGTQGRPILLPTVRTLTLRRSPVRIPKVMDSFPHVTDLTIDCGSDSIGNLVEVCKRLPHLETLRVRYRTSYTAPEFGYVYDDTTQPLEIPDGVAVHFSSMIGHPIPPVVAVLLSKNLESVDLNLNIDRAFTEVIIERCKRLKSVHATLDPRSPGLITNLPIVKLVTTCGRGDFHQPIGQHFKHLKSLVIYRNVLDGPCQVFDLDVAPHIEYLELRFWTVHPKYLDSLACDVNLFRCISSVTGAAYPDGKVSEWCHRKGSRLSEMVWLCKWGDLI